MGSLPWSVLVSRTSMPIPHRRVGSGWVRDSSPHLRRVEKEDDAVAGGDLSDAATMIAEERPEGVPVLGGRTEHEATRCFVDKRGERVESVERHHHRPAEHAAIAALADGNRKTALTAIVGCGDLAVQIAAWIAR